MLIRIVVACLLFTLSPQALSYAQGTPTATVGWYNGDCLLPRSTYANWYISQTQFDRVYDDFVVPAGGWTVAGVFSNDTLNAAVTQASWEIRSGVSAGNGGTVVASGLDPATQTYNPASNTYRIEVDGLHVQLAPGAYWLSVTPVGTSQYESYVCATLGANAVSYPPGNNGYAFQNFPPQYVFGGQLQITVTGGTTGDFSQGLLISAGTTPVLVSDLWRSDLTSLVQQMAAHYAPAFPGISMTAWQANAATLSARAPTISDAEIRTGLQALVASIEDPHTDVEWFYPVPFRFLPLTFYWFDDGIYVTKAPAQYRNLLGGKVTSIGQVAIDDATLRLTALVAHENDSWVKYYVPYNKLINTDFLFGTGVTSATDGAQIVVQSPSGEVVSVNVQAASQSSPMIDVFQGSSPLYRQNFEKTYWTSAGMNYWAEVIDRGATVYFQYNSCNEDPKQPSADFFKLLNPMLAQNGVERVILDMRNNNGGFVSILDPWIDQIKLSRFNQPGRLYVIVGRATFSAAMYASDRLRQETAAIFVGEPTGGKPRFMNRAGDFLLPYFGIGSSYSNGIMNATDPGPTLMPDIRTGLTFQQYMNGEDPAMEAIPRDHHRPRQTR